MPLSVGKGEEMHFPSGGQSGNYMDTNVLIVRWQVWNGAIGLKRGSLITENRTCDGHRGERAMK